MISEESQRLLQNNADQVRKRLADIQTAIGQRPADPGQYSSSGTPEDVKAAVYNLTQVVLELAVALGEVQAVASTSLQID